MDQAESQTHSADYAPLWEDDHAELFEGNATDILRSLPERYVSCCVTSPPYFGLRDYGVPGQIGLEKSPTEYVHHLVEVFGEVRRVLDPAGTLWLNLGDSYANDEKWGGSTGGKHAASLHGATGVGRGKKSTGLSPKNLIGAPWRVAFALQEDGWTLRNAIVWHKPNAMPHSVQDRLSSRYEMIFLLTPSPRYWFDLDAIREPLAYPEALDGSRIFGGANRGTAGGIGATERNRGHNAYGSRSYPEGVQPQENMGPTGERHSNGSEKGKNPGDVWSITTKPNPEAHFATFPLDLPLRCIKAGCEPGGRVLDPFSGSGTTGAAARKLGRRYTGIDINGAYHRIAIKRFSQGLLGLEDPDSPVEVLDLDGNRAAPRSAPAQ